MATALSAQPRRIINARRERAERSGVRGRRLVWAGLLVIGLIGAVLVHVWVRLQVVRMGYVLSTTSRLQTRLEQENRELKVELATMTSPERLDALARQRLGLVHPEKGQVVVLP